MADVEKLGIDKLEALIVEVTKVVMKVVKLSKDGVQLEDAMALAADEDVKALIRLIVAYKDVIAQVKDVELAEAIQLAASVVPQILEIAKK